MCTWNFSEVVSRHCPSTTKKIEQRTVDKRYLYAGIDIFFKFNLPTKYVESKNYYLKSINMDRNYRNYGKCRKCSSSGGNIFVMTMSCLLYVPV